MKVAILLLMLIVTFKTTSAALTEVIYLRIEPMIGSGQPLGGTGLGGGCYIEPGKECKGTFYLNDEGSGVRMGAAVKHTDPIPTFEILYSLTLIQESGRDMLVGLAYAMNLSSDGDILGGSRTEIHQPIVLGQEIVMAQPVGRLNSGQTVFLQIWSEIPESKQANESLEHPITLISTYLESDSHPNTVRNWYSNVSNVYKFRAGFRSEERNGACDVLKYDVRIEIDDFGINSSSDADASGQAVESQLSFKRIYTIDTLNHSIGSFSPDVTYVSEHKKDLLIRPGRTLKLIFPPDTPSVHGFDIEDTLIITPPSDSPH